MGLDPNIADMEAQMHLLYDWTQTYYPDGCFEVRCINPKDRHARSPNERFHCSPDGYQQAIRYAVQLNGQGYNIYLTVNPLKPGTNHPATDDDVEIAIHQFADADELEDADRLAIEGSQGFKPTFSTLTGSVPKPRHHIYWRRDEPVTEMAAWRSTQAAVAQKLGTDQTVKNPSRVDRLAGSVSYPPPHKQERGYVTELTSLCPTVNGEVCGKSFAASFACAEPEVEMPPPVSRNRSADAQGLVPIDVIEAAFDAIPVLMGKGHYNTWLDISMCAKAANPHCFPEFDEWQRQSDRYKPADSWGWPLSKDPRQGSYLGLFAHAKRGDERWWARDPDSYEWWCREQARRTARQHPAFGDEEPVDPTVDEALKATVHGDSQKQEPRYTLADLFPILSERELMDQTQMQFLIEDFIPEDSVVGVWGESQDCKSFLIIDMLECLAHGYLWHGHKTKKCGVAYIVAEGTSGVGKRVRGWKLQHKAECVEAPFYAIPTAINILVREEVEKLIWQLKAMEGVLDIKFEVVAIDTLAKCMVGGDENTARDMGMAIRHCDLIRERMGGISVLLVHHCGKDTERGPRGSYAFVAGVNAQIRVVRTRSAGEDFITVSTDKQKDHDDDVKIRLKVVKVWLPLRPGDNPHKQESTLILDTYTMDCPKAEPKPLPGCEIDAKFADLMSIASILGDGGKKSASDVARVVFGHDRYKQRVIDAVPMEWTEVQTNFGPRYVRRMITVTQTGKERHHVECRHQEV